jgi:hypothetical protein
LDLAKQERANLTLFFSSLNLRFYSQLLLLGMNAPNQVQKWQVISGRSQKLPMSKTTKIGVQMDGLGVLTENKPR